MPRHLTLPTWLQHCSPFGSLYSLQGGSNFMVHNMILRLHFSSEHIPQKHSFIHMDDSIILVRNLSKVLDGFRRWVGLICRRLSILLVGIQLSSPLPFGDCRVQAALEGASIQVTPKRPLKNKNSIGWRLFARKLKITRKLSCGSTFGLYRCTYQTCERLREMLVMESLQQFGGLWNQKPFLFISLARPPGQANPKSKPADIPNLEKCASNWRPGTLKWAGSSARVASAHIFAWYLCGWLGCRLY